MGHCFWNGNFSLPTPWLSGSEKITSFQYFRFPKNLFCGVKHVTLVPYKTVTELESLTKKLSWMHQNRKEWWQIYYWQVISTQEIVKFFQMNIFMPVAKFLCLTILLCILQKEGIFDLCSVQGAFQRNQRLAILHWERKREKKHEWQR